MRLTRILLWSTAILAAVILIGCLTLALLFPWNALEEGFKGELNDRIRPLHVDFASIRLVLHPGPGLAVDAVRLYAPETEADTDPDPWLSVARLTLCPSLAPRDLAARRIALHCIAESPTFHAEQAGREADAAVGLAGALGQVPGPGEAENSPRPESLAALVMPNMEPNGRVASPSFFLDQTSKSLTLWEAKLPLSVTSNLSAPAIASDRIFVGNMSTLITLL